MNNNNINRWFTEIKIENVGNNHSKSTGMLFIEHEWAWLIGPSGRGLALIDNDAPDINCARRPLRFVSAVASSEMSLCRRPL